jgi:Membrane proteins related to metalloendopeptidases
LQFAVKPDSLTVKGFKDNEQVFEGNFEDITNTLKYSSDTNLVFEVTAQWFAVDKNSPYFGEATYKINTLYDIPATFKLEDKSLTPGGFTIIKAINFNEDEPILVESNLKYSKSAMHINGTEKFLFLTIGLDNPAGNYILHISGGSSSDAFNFTVKDKTFPINTLNVTDATLKTKNTEETWKEYKDKMTPLLSQSEEKKLWEGDFVKPVIGDEIIAFGTERFVSTITSNYHSDGIDIKAPTGTEVKATNSGKVVFTGELALTGKTVVIDHGFGVFSYYGNLNSIDCTVGASIAKNVKVGTVGQTGFAPTPQLHFAMSIGDSYINPIYKTGITYPK